MTIAAAIVASLGPGSVTAMGITCQVAGSGQAAHLIAPSYIPTRKKLGLQIRRALFRFDAAQYDVHRTQMPQVAIAFPPLPPPGPLVGLHAALRMLGLVPAKEPGQGLLWDEHGYFICIQDAIIIPWAGGTLLRLFYLKTTPTEEKNVIVMLELSLEQMLYELGARRKETNGNTTALALISLR